MISEEKQSLRVQARGSLKAMDLQSKRHAAREILCRLLVWPAWVNARTICAYAALSDEPDILEPWPEHKLVILPRIQGSDIELHFVKSPERLVPGPFGIREPACDASLSPPRADLILVPGLAFDHSGARLGRGGGFYDRLLETFEGIRVGVCFNESLCKKIPIEAHDVRMDFLATPGGIISCG